MANWFTRTVSPTAIKNEYRQELLAAARNVRTAEQGEAFLDDVFRYEDKFTGPKTPAAKELNKKFDFASKDGADADLRNSIKAAVYNSLPSSEAAELALKNSRYRGDGEAEEALQNKIRNNPNSLDVLRANLTPDNASSLSPDLAQTLVGSAGNDTKKVAQTLISVYEEVQKQPDRSLARRDLRNAYATLHNAAVTLHPELKPTRQTEPAAPAKNIIAGDDLGLSVAAKERAMVAAANDMPKPPVPVAKHESTPPVAKHAEPVKPVVEKHEPKPVAAEKPVAKPVEPKASLEDKLEKLSNKKGLLLERGEVKNSKDLATVQEGLKKSGYLEVEDRNLGKVFGAKTEDAVKRFQADVGLKVDGDVGIRTATALKAYHSLPKTKDDGTEPTKDERINAAKEAIEKGKADKKFTDQNIGDKAEAKIAQSASKLDPTVQTSGIAANTVQSQTAAKQHAV